MSSDKCNWGYWNIISYLFMTTIIETGGLMCFCSKRADDVKKDCKNQEF
jgi:hypothetical protein